MRDIHKDTFTYALQNHYTSPYVYLHLTSPCCKTLKINMLKTKNLVV